MADTSSHQEPRLSLWAVQGRHKPAEISRDAMRAFAAYDALELQLPVGAPARQQAMTSD